MKTICHVCKYECEEDLKKCPRCGSILYKRVNCHNCKGCSLRGKCKTNDGEK